MQRRDVRRVRKVVRGVTYRFAAPLHPTENKVFEKCRFIDASSIVGILDENGGDNPGAWKAWKNVVFRDCLFKRAVFRDDMFDCEFIRCTFDGNSDPRTPPPSLLTESELSTTSFIECNFDRTIAIGYSSVARGIQFIRCHFNGHAGISKNTFGDGTGRISGVRLDGSTFITEMEVAKDTGYDPRHSLPINYTWETPEVVRVNRVVQANGIIEIGDARSQTYRQGNELLKNSSGGFIDGLVFMDLDMTVLDVNNFTFSGCWFVRCNFSGIIVKGAGCNFSACNMRSSTLKEIDYARFLSCDMQMTNGSDSTMNHVEFDGCNLRDSNMSSYSARECTFRKCVLIGCSMRQGSVMGFRGNLDNAILDDAAALDTDAEFLHTVTAPMPNGQPWDRKLFRPTWELDSENPGTPPRFVARAWSRK